jgi:type II secretory ATPase GspE/PulE/Tfp pilus assembly ATPase PilB-like protein
MGKFKMTIEDQLIKILNDAIGLNANNIHFTLACSGDVVIQFRSGNLLLLPSYVPYERYKELFEYIESHTVFEASNIYEWIPKTGYLTINECQKEIECYVSILSTAKFDSLVLRIKKPRIKANSRQLKNLIERSEHSI